MKFIIFFWAIGFSLLGYTLTLPSYKNPIAYENQYMAIIGNDDNAYQAFYKLREKFLTPKHSLEDYAFTILILALVFTIIYALGGKSVTSPASKKKVQLIGFLAALSIPLSYILETVINYIRGEYPHWGDTLTIPFFLHAPIFLIISLVWMLMHFYFLKEPFTINSKIIRKFTLKNNLNLWLIGMSLLSAFIIVKAVIWNEFEIIIPGFLWLYFYLSLLVGKTDPLTDKVKV